MTGSTILSGSNSTVVGNFNVSGSTYLSGSTNIAGNLTVVGGTFSYSGSVDSIRRQFTNATTVMTISGSSSQTSQLSVGCHSFKSTIDYHILQGATGLTATTSNYPIFAGQEIYIQVDNATTQGYVAAITNGGTGSLAFKTVEVV